MRRDLNVVVQIQDLRLSGRAFQMHGAAEEKDLSSPHECRDLGSMRRSMELELTILAKLQTKNWGSQKQGISCLLQAYLTGPKFMKLLIRKTCLTKFFAKQKLSGTPVTTM